MSRLTPVFLLLLVAGLGVAIYFQTRREVVPQLTTETELVEGLRTSDLTKIRIDNIERRIHLSLEKDTTGRWVITDPIAYPVRKDMLVQLVGVLERNEGFLVPESAEDAIREDLEKPYASLTLTRLLDGKEVTDRILLGSVDIDGQAINAMVGNRVLRTRRNLIVAVDTSVLDWRSRSTFNLAHDSIVEIRREGIDPTDEGPVDLTLICRRDASGWRITSPVELRGDPYIAVWATVLSQLKVESFRSDTAEPDLAEFGLELPAFTLTLKDKHGQSQTLEFGRPSLGGPYFARRTGSQYIWVLDPRSFSQIFFDKTRLFDPVIAHLPSENIERIFLLDDELEIRLTQDLRERAWTVARRPTGGTDDEWTVDTPARENGIDELLSVLGQEQGIAGYDFDADVSDHFDDSAPTNAIWLESGGVRYGGRLGKHDTTPEGTPVQAFLREREQTVSFVPPNVSDVLDRPFENWVSLEIISLTEPFLQTLEIVRGDVHRRFKRAIQGTWQHQDLGTDALSELFPVIEHLVFLKADRHVSADERVPLVDPVTVRFRARDGEITQFEVGATADGEVRVDHLGRQAVVSHQPLHAGLVKITTPR